MKRLAILAILCTVAYGSNLSAGDRLASRPVEDVIVGLPSFACAETGRSLFGTWGAYLRGEVPIRKSMSLNYGMSYGPNSDVDMLLTSFQWTCKYEDFWLHDAPESLMFRLELAVGSRLKRKVRGVISCGMFAQYYFRSWSTDVFQPYIDAGIGIIYTDFQNEKQGLRVNFNPRLSLGTDVKIGDSTYFAAIRAFHVSNADLHEENHGINGAMVVFGKYF